MKTFNFLILNGPNLKYLGKRQPDIYGHEGMDNVQPLVQQLMPNTLINLEFFQSNSEGGLIDRLEQAYEQGLDGIVFNAGAYTHTSLALSDCLAWIKIPCVEVHLSNVLARGEVMRQKSFIGRHALGVIAGFGITSYALAVQALVQYLINKK